MAMGLRLLLAPLRVLGAPVDEIGLTLLLSLRFMSLVFDEMRNLCLGLAARAVPWKQLPPMAGIQVTPVPL
jgi:general transcription factor 3C polypeptide 2